MNSVLATKLRVLGLLALINAEALAQNPPVTPPAQPVAQPAPQRGGNRGRAAIRVMSLTSPAFTDGGMIPAKHAQPGRDVSPPLAWSGAPDSVTSYVLIVHDIDAVAANGMDDALHWMVWNIPGSVTSLAEGVPQGPQLPLPVTSPAAPGGGRGGGRGVGGGGMRQLSVSGPYYRGPAAPSTGPAHHYVFELYALDVNVNVQAAGQSIAPTRTAIMDAMKDHVRGKGVLVGLYRRAEPPQP